MESKELAFIIPNDIFYEGDTSNLTDIQLIRWHDMMHVFFERLLDGLGQFGEFKWSFNRVILKHEEIISEMSKRQIPHYSPYNNLDIIKSNILVTQKIENKTFRTSELSEEESKDNSVNISFDSPNQVEK